MILSLREKLYMKMNMYENKRLCGKYGNVITIWLIYIYKYELEKILHMSMVEWWISWYNLIVPFLIVVEEVLKCFT